jgi:hypothetical protein
VSIRIVAEGDLYRVTVSPPHGSSWTAPEPITATEVLGKLELLGCHVTDVTDALAEANPNWGESHDREVRRRRSADHGKDSA